MLERPPILKEGHSLAKCCSPEPDDAIRGYVNYDKQILVHKAVCHNLKKIEPGRLVFLSWDQILEEKAEKPDSDYLELEKLDFRILEHHRVMGVDYSLMVARILQIEPAKVFEHHRKLQKLKLLERVKKVMIRYRKGVVDNKWIKHRNHTYYRITPRGEKYLNFYSAQKENL